MNVSIASRHASSLWVGSIRTPKTSYVKGDVAIGRIEKAETAIDKMNTSDPAAKAILPYNGRFSSVIIKPTHNAIANTSPPSPGVNVKIAAMP